MLPGAASLAALNRIRIWLRLTASSLVLLADYPQQREKRNHEEKKKKHPSPFLSLSLSPSLAHKPLSPVGTVLAFWFFLMSLKLIFSHDCIPFSEDNQRFWIIAAVWLENWGRSGMVATSLCCQLKDNFSWALQYDFTTYLSNGSQSHRTCDPPPGSPAQMSSSEIPAEFHIVAFSICFWESTDSVLPQKTLWFRLFACNRTLFFWLPH